MAIFILIPLLPLLAFLILALGGQRWGEQSHRIGIPAIGHFIWLIGFYAFFRGVEERTFYPFPLSSLSVWITGH